MGTSMRSWRVGATLAVSVGAFSLGSLPYATKSAATAPNAPANGWLQWFAEGQKAAEQTGKPLFVVIT